MVSWLASVISLDIAIPKGKSIHENKYGERVVKGNAVMVENLRVPRSRIRWFSNIKQSLFSLFKRLFT